MSNKTIPVPVKVLKKIASFVSKVPNVVSGLMQETPPVDYSKQANACVDGLVQYAGLTEEKRAAFAEFVSTPEGALQTITSLTNKIAAQNEEIEAAKQLSLGAPSKRASLRNDTPDSSRVWCETLLG